MQELWTGFQGSFCVSAGEAVFLVMEAEAEAERERKEEEEEEEEERGRGGGKEGGVEGKM